MAMGIVTTTTSIIGTMATIIIGMTTALGRAGLMVGTTAMAIIGSGAFAAKAGSWCRYPPHPFTCNRPRS